MVASVLVVLAFIYFLAKLPHKERLVFQIINPKKYILPIILASIVLFIIANSITGGNLALRYQGETTGTQISGEEVSLNKFTSNRIEILAEDFAIWMQYPIFGSGAASSKYLRILTKDTVTHIEFSRLIAEHGFLGVLIIVFFFRMYFKIKNEKMDGVNKAIQLGFFILAIASSFHAATRTFITPLLIILSSIKIVDTSKKERQKIQNETPKMMVSNIL